MIPADDFVFSEAGTKSVPDQRRQELWGEAITRALDV
jgi:hypothetical protein